MKACACLNWIYGLMLVKCKRINHFFLVSLGFCVYLVGACNSIWYEGQSSQVWPWQAQLNKIIEAGSYFSICLRKHVYVFLFGSVCVGGGWNISTPFDSNRYIMPQGKRRLLCSNRCIMPQGKSCLLCNLLQDLAVIWFRFTLLVCSTFNSFFALFL